MGKFIESIRRERLYLLLFIFIVTINMLMVLTGDIKGKAKKRHAPTNVVGLEEMEAKDAGEDIFLKRERIEKVLHEKKYLALVFKLASLLILAVIFLGILVDAILVSIKFAKKNLDLATYRMQAIRWGVLDVVKVVILFLFFGYIVIIIESCLAPFFPLLKNDNFRMILNSSILDALTVVFIIHFTVVRYKEGLVSLGLSVKNFFKNVFYGIAGYIATIPMLVGILIIISVIINVTKYVPEKQHVVELFLKEKNLTFLVYTSIFASIVGPFIEELFFRGFMYNAFKKSIGIFWAALFTSGLFASLHANVVGFLPIMVLGITLTYLYEKTGTLVSSITVHIMHNLSMVCLVFLMKQIRI